MTSATPKMRRPTSRDFRTTGSLSLIDIISQVDRSTAYAGEARRPLEGVGAMHPLRMPDEPPASRSYLVIASAIGLRVPGSRAARERHFGAAAHGAAISPFRSRSRMPSTAARASAFLGKVSS